MSGEHEGRDSSLIPSGRLLPAKAALVARGIELAANLLADERAEVADEGNAPHIGIAVFRVFSLIDGDLLEERPWPSQCDFLVGDVAGALTKFPQRAGEAGSNWRLAVRLGEESSARVVFLPLATFLTNEQYRRSLVDPLCFAELCSEQSLKAIVAGEDARLSWLWWYRDVIYITERSPRPSEMDEVATRIKSIHFQRGVLDDYIERWIPRDRLAAARARIADARKIWGNLFDDHQDEILKVLQQTPELPFDSAVAHVLGPKLHPKED
jgi:hypothetical protein